MANEIKQQKTSEQPKQPSRVDLARSVGGFGKTLISSGSNLVFGALGSQIGGAISDYYNRKSEERMDKRNRQLIIDTPILTTEGRRRAGLNPYGDPILPGMSSQSSTDTSDVAPGSFYNAQQMTLQERIAVTQLENETKVADSQANRNNAEADRLRGVERRDVAWFDLETALKRANVTSVEENNKLLAIEREIRDATKDSEIKYSEERLNKVISDIAYVEEMTKKAQSAQEVDDALVKHYTEMDKTLRAEAELMIAQKAFVEQNKELVWWQKEFKAQEYAWYNGDMSVNGVRQPGLWEVAVKLQSANISELEALANYYQTYVDNLPAWKREEFNIMWKNAESMAKQAFASLSSAKAQGVQASAAQQQADNSTVSLIMKIVGGILIIGGVVGTPFTAGGSVPLIGAGGAMLLGS